MTTRPILILTIALCVASLGFVGCSSEDANLASPDTRETANRETIEPVEASPWSVNGGRGTLAPVEGPDEELVWGTGESAPGAAAVLPAEIQFSGTYTEIATSGLVTLSWDAPTTDSDGSGPVTDLLGYSLYYGPSASDLSTVVNVGNVTTVELELPIGTHYVAVRAFDTWDNISDFSNVIQVTVAGPS